MSLEYWKDGKRVKIHPIYDVGRVRQMVILDQVSFEENPDSEKYPLAHYPQPYLFTIIIVGKTYYYMVDAEGEKVACDKNSINGSGSLYDAMEWLAWQRSHHEDKLRRKERKIEQLEGHVALLRDILIKQGFRVLTPEQAKELEL